MFRPLLPKDNFEQVSLWQGDRFTLQRRFVEFFFLHIYYTYKLYPLARSSLQVCAFCLFCESIHSEIESVDQTSIKDSGKGDSDSNDSDSDSGKASLKIANISHQRASSKLCFILLCIYSLNMLASFHHLIIKPLISLTECCKNR